MSSKIVNHESTVNSENVSHMPLNVMNAMYSNTSNTKAGGNITSSANQNAATNSMGSASEEVMNVLLSMVQSPKFSKTSLSSSSSSDAQAQYDVRNGSSGNTTKDGIETENGNGRDGANSMSGSRGGSGRGRSKSFGDCHPSTAFAPSTGMSQQQSQQHQQQIQDRQVN
jgi:hypothetical protein